MSEVKEIKTKEDWDTFIKGDVINFLINNGLQRIIVEDGSGKKGQVKINANGEYKIQITSNETM